MRIQKFFLVFLIFLFLHFCREGPVEHIRKAKKALKNEDTSLAILHFQKAYESSLEDAFFLVPKDDHFSEMEVSGDQKHLLLVSAAKEESEFIYKSFHDNDEHYEEISDHLDGEVRHAYISFYGNYVLFVVSLPDKADCTAVIWESQHDRFIKTIPNLSCLDRPAVSSGGVVIFMRKNRIWYLELKGPSGEASGVLPWVNKVPDKPVQKQPARASFAFAPDGSPFMTYGGAGNYKLYKLANKSLGLLSKQASHYKIFFIQNEAQPGVITGGASQQKLTFLNPDQPNRITKKYDFSAVKDISFVEEDQYYSIRSNRLYLFKSGESIPLPFLAQKIFARKNGDVFFLSSIGTAMRYGKALTNEISRSIFKRILDIEESK